jgi:transcriptional regulator with XRE-family HTH domain
MSKKDLQKFGKRLKALRLERDLTQLELAEILDMSPNFVGMIERANATLPLKMYLTLPAH